MPTVEDLAILSTKRLLKQWSEYEPKMFVISRAKKNPCIKGVRAPKGTLLSDLLKLSQKKVNDWYPEHTEAKSKNNLKSLNPDLLPDWERIYQICEVETESVYRKKKKKPTRLDILNTFWLKFKHEFKALEPMDRWKKRLTLTKGIGKRKRVEEPSGQGGPTHARKKRQLCPEKQMDCQALAPQRAGGKAKMRCWLCGYAINGKDELSKVTMECCKRYSHHRCWSSQQSMDKRCETARYFLQKDRKSKEKIVVKNSHQHVADFACPVCDEIFDAEKESDMDSAKDHLLRKCRGLPKVTQDLDLDDENGLVNRIAEVALFMAPNAVRRRPPREITDSYRCSVSNRHDADPSIGTNESV